MNIVPLLLLVLVFDEVYSECFGLKLKINQGILQGKYQQSRKGRQYRAFTGIPYAQPPVGELRFRPPLPPKSWKGLLNATGIPPKCPQRQAATIVGSEDCLYLNVYTPKLTSTHKRHLPVMLYIHGGSFIVGSGGPDALEADYLLDKDIILVISNYRLGALGFLSTGDAVVPGNNGLKDLAQVLNWIKKNVAQFGGDPKKITVVGYSAGAAAAHFLTLSPLSKDVISGAIIESGTAISGWALAKTTEAISNTRKLAELVNCSTTSTLVMIECLKTIDPYVIAQQDFNFFKWASDPIAVFIPVVEPNVRGAFITEHPFDIIQSGKAANVPLIIGISTDDGAPKSAYYYNDSQLINELDQNFKEVIPISLDFDNNSNKTYISQKLRNFYLGDLKIDNSTKKQLTQLFTDVSFLLGGDISVRLQAKYNTKPVFYNLFGYRGSETQCKFYGDNTYNYGVCHGDLLLYLFRLKGKFPDYVPNATENKMTDIMIDMWTNFVATGNPNGNNTALMNITWQPTDFKENLSYLFIKSPDDVQMAKGLYTDRAKFVSNLNIYFENPFAND